LQDELQGWVICACRYSKFNIQEEGCPKMTADILEGIYRYMGVEYAHNGYLSLLADIYVPEHDEADAAPLIIWVHGGGWKDGNRKAWPGILRQLARGYAVMSVEYTLTGAGPDKASFPTQIKDIKAAIKWARANGDEYGFDASRIVIAGISAGGHLSALAGCTNGMKEFEYEELYAGFSSDVHGVVDLLGPSDLYEYISETTIDEVVLALRQLTDCEDSMLKDKLIYASPVTYIDGTEPPFLIMHGDKDTLVNMKQSEILHKRLVEKGVDSTLYIIKGLPHAYFEEPKAFQLMDKFFDKCLKCFR
jgi:acetyl esterase/lipase